MVKIKINIQSFSDIITNSSSELFCSVYGNDQINIDELKSILETIFVCDYDEGYIAKRDYEYDSKTGEEIGCKPYLEVMLGYHNGISDEYLRATLELYLDSKIGSGNYKIEFN